MNELKLFEVNENLAVNKKDITYFGTLVNSKLFLREAHSCTYIDTRVTELTVSNAAEKITDFYYEDCCFYYLFIIVSFCITSYHLLTLLYHIVIFSGGSRVL